MNPKHNSSSLNEFFKNYEEKNPAYVLGLMIISFGLYIFTWIYKINVDLEQLDEDSPESVRGAVLMAVLPFTWFFITTLIKEFINSIIIRAIEIIVYVLIYFLVLKYLFEFCIAFSHVTRTRALIWFVPFAIGSFGFFGYYLQSIIVGSFLMMFFLVIPAMQAELNTTYHKISIKKNNHAFYS